MWDIEEFLEELRKTNPDVREIAYFYLGVFSSSSSV